MKVEYIANTGTDTVLALIKDKARRCTEFYISVAFITQAGLDELISSIRLATNFGKVRVLTGFYSGITEPEALYSFMKLEREKGKRFQSYIYGVNNTFHKKIYLFRKQQFFFAIVGSSNLTSHGLVNEGEGNVFITGDVNKTNDKIFIEDLLKDFHRSRSNKLTKDIIQDYAIERSLYNEVLKKKVKINTKRILKKNSKQKENQKFKAIDKPGYYFDVIDGNVTAKTEFIISNETNWDKFEWYGVRKRIDLKENDIIYLLDKNNSKLFPAQYKDYWKTKYKTNDGTHFCAFMPLKKYKRINKNLMASLKRIKLEESKIKSLKKLQLNQIDYLKKILN